MEEARIARALNRLGEDSFLLDSDGDSLLDLIDDGDSLLDLIDDYFDDAAPPR